MVHAGRRYLALLLCAVLAASIAQARVTAQQPDDAGSDPALEQALPTESAPRERPPLPEGKPVTAPGGPKVEPAESDEVVAPVPPPDPGGGGGGGPATVSSQGSEIYLFAATEQSSLVYATLLTDPYRYRFHDSNGMVAGVNCVQITPNEADCAAPTAFTIFAYLGDGDDSYYQNSLHPVDAANVYGGIGNDGLFMGGMFTTSGFGPMYVQGDEGTDYVYYQDSTTAAGSTYTVTSGAITRNNSGGSLSYQAGTVEGLVVLAGSGADTINVTSTPAGVGTQIAPTPIGESVADIVNIGTGNIGSVAGPVAVGGTASDAVYLHDATFGFDDYTVTAFNVTRAGFGGLSYNGVGSVVVNGQTGGANAYTVAGTGTQVTLNAGPNDDSFNVGPDLDNLVGRLIVNGGDGPGTDSLVADDTSNFFNDAITVTFGNIERFASGGISYGGLESLTLNAQTVGSVIAVDSTSATTYVNANGGDDSIYVGGGAMTFLGGPVVVDGGAQADTVYASDGFSNVHTYTVNSNAIGRTSSFGFTYTNSEAVILLAGSGDSTINVTDTNAGVSYQLEGGDGNDGYNIGPNLGLMAGPIYVSGGGGVFDSVVFDDTAGAGPRTYDVRGGSRLDRIGMPPITQIGVEQEQLYGTAAGDTMRLMTTSALTSSLLLGLGGSDAVSVFSAGLAFAGAAALYGGSGTNDTLSLYTGGLGSTFSGPNTISGPSHHNVSHFEFESTSTASTSADADGDGCPDNRELGNDEEFAGLRNPADFYDWFDVAAIGGGARDGVIDLSDALAVLGRFGQLPPGPPYQATFDRVTGPATQPWRARAATGIAVGIDLTDVLVNLESFGHDCVND